jgi:hypothetical protein
MLMCSYCAIPLIICYSRQKFVLIINGGLRSECVSFYETDLDIRPRSSYIAKACSPGTPSGRYAARWSRYGARARTYHPLPGSFGSSARSALRPVCEKHRCTETGKLRGKPDGGLIPGSAELKLGGGVRSPKPEPWWNADRRAAPEASAGGNIGRRGAEDGNQTAFCRRSASLFLFVCCCRSLFLPFVIAYSSLRASDAIQTASAIALPKNQFAHRG